MPSSRGRFISNARRLIAVSTGTVLLLVGVAWAGTPVPVIDSPRALEQYPAASQGYLVWSRVTRNGANSFVKPDGEPKIRMNRPGGHSTSAGIDGTTAVYDVQALSGRGNTNLRMFDVLTQTRSDPPDGVNTGQHEYRPSLSGDWLLFTRDAFRPAAVDTYRIRVILFNTSTSEARVLENLRGKNHYLASNSVNGNWATFESCNYNPRTDEFSNCNVHLYQISTETLTQIPNPNRQQYSSSVTGDGTVYFARGRNQDHWVCGRGAQVVRLPNGGSETVIATIPRGKDVFSTFALEEADTSTTLFLGRQPCRGGRFPRGGIFEIRNADPAT